ncbi:MAG: hypothetical protein H0X63_11630 [Flavobacteriales bacterium]|nr:hypothetical protein [Flavobacteriales bacterium]
MLTSFINKFFIFNLSKDFFFLHSFVSINNNFFVNAKEVIFFNKSSYFSFINHVKRVVDPVVPMFIIRLFLKGVGYKILRSRLACYNQIYRFELGYSVVRYVFVPKSVYCKHRRDRITIFGTVKDDVVRVAKLFIGLRCPDVYKGKGVRDAFYTFEPKPGKQR